MKQTIKIEVPDGKKAIWKDNRIYFEDVDTMESIKTIEDAAQFLLNKGNSYLGCVLHSESGRYCLYLTMQVQN